MTLTTILPTLRRSIPDPLEQRSWPEHTHATTTDVIVSGVSLLRLVDICDPPCVHTGDAFVPETSRRPLSSRDAAVVVARITAVIDTGESVRVVLVDGCLDTVTAIWEETRLIGRASTARPSRTVVLSGDSHRSTHPAPSLASLPDDLVVGDLLAIPCAGMVTLHDLRSAALEPVAEPERDAVRDTLVGSGR